MITLSGFPWTLFCCWISILLLKNQPYFDPKIVCLKNQYYSMWFGRNKQRRKNANKRKGSRLLDKDIKYVYNSSLQGSISPTYSLGFFVCTGWEAFFGHTNLANCKQRVANFSILLVKLNGKYFDNRCVRQLFAWCAKVGENDPRRNTEGLLQITHLFRYRCIVLTTRIYCFASSNVKF